MQVGKFLKETNSKTIKLNLNISVITLNVNGLNASIKGRDYHTRFFKNKSQLHSVYKNLL